MLVASLGALKKLHTVGVIFEQERPVAGVNGRRGCLWLDHVRVGVRLHERHCMRQVVVAGG